MKTPTYLLPIVLLFSLSNLYAQDVIYLSDGSKEEGKISLISKSKITYKKADNPNGPDHELEKEDVLMVVYENGNHEVFNGKKKTDPRATDFGRHFVSWQFTDLLATNVTVAYEFFNKSGTLGFRLPLSFGFNKDAVHYPGDPEVFGTQGRIFASALEMNYYPTGQGRAKYFVGPSLGFGLNRYYYYNYNWLEGDLYGYEENKGEAYRFSLLINNGVMFQPTKHFNITTSLGLGMSSYFNTLNKQNDYGYYTDDFTPAVTLSVSAGYRF